MSGPGRGNSKPSHSAPQVQRCSTTAYWTRWRAAGTAVCGPGCRRWPCCSVPALPGVTHDLSSRHSESKQQHILKQQHSLELQFRVQKTASAMLATPSDTLVRAVCSQALRLSNKSTDLAYSP